MKQEIEINKIIQFDSFTLHFAVCMKIRNRFLWNNKEITQILMNYFKSDNIDCLSHAIWQEITKN